MVWVKSPLTEITERCLLGPALLKLPHRELALVFLSHFTLGRYLHSEFSQIVPVQRAGPAARLICRILRELMIHPTVGVFLTKNIDRLFMAQPAFPRGKHGVYMETRDPDPKIHSLAGLNILLCHFIIAMSSVFKCPSTENRKEKKTVR